MNARLPAETPVESLEARLKRASALNEFEVDDFGFRPTSAAKALKYFVWLYRHYFRVKAFGFENFPAGRFMLVSNHSGQLPFDAAMLLVAGLLEGEPPRLLRGMVERWASTLPFIAPLFARVGQVVGTPANAHRLLEAGQALMVFPEGVRGLVKPSFRRYQLAEFGQGFMRIAVATQTPVLPVAVIGAEEQTPTFANVKSIAKRLNLPAFPLTPYLLPIPLPVKYRIYVGAPRIFEGRSDDDQAIRERVAVVRKEVQALIAKGLRERPGVFR